MALKKKIIFRTFFKQFLKIGTSKNSRGGLEWGSRKVLVMSIRDLFMPLIMVHTYKLIWRRFGTFETSRNWWVIIEIFMQASTLHQIQMQTFRVDIRSGPWKSTWKTSLNCCGEDSFEALQGIWRSNHTSFVDLRGKVSEVYMESSVKAVFGP